ncbi:MAG: methyltransferase domain-containing protein [Phycisphaerales bacterium]
MHKDRSIVVIDKTPGLLVAGPKSKSGQTVVKLVARAMNTRATPTPANQLDKEASGAVILAASPREASSFEIALHRGARNWMAVVVGEPPAESGTLVSRLHVSSRGVMEPVPSEELGNESAARAVLHYRVVASGNGMALLRIRGETDVPGQVRAQLAEAGLPIVGDKIFNAERDDLGRLGLHLAELVCDDPREHRGVPRTFRFVSPTPAEFWTALGLDAPKHARQPAPPESGPKDSADAGWDHVAEWYDDLIENRRSDHHDEVVHPGVQRMLDLKPGERVLDIACGQGELAALLARSGADVTGVDASPALIERAREHAPERLTFMQGDARELAGLDAASFDAAVCVLALMNIDPIEPVFERVRALLKPDGRAVFVVMHPAFRVPKASGWAWSDREGKTVQRRMIERYNTPFGAPIVMNPGEVASGAEPITTTSHHRPIGALVRAASAAGLVVDGLEEWSSNRESESGPRAEAENAARREIPMFLALRVRPSRDG